MRALYDTNGAPLDAAGPISNITFSFRWGSPQGGGLDTVSWSQELGNTAQPQLTVGQKVTLKYGAQVLGSAHISSADFVNGKFTADGLVHAGEKYDGVDSTASNPYAPTGNPKKAIQSRLAELGWTLDSATAALLDTDLSAPQVVPATDPAPALSNTQWYKITDIMAAWVGTQPTSTRWWIDPYGAVKIGTDPATDKARIRPSTPSLGAVSDDYVTHLYVKYQDGYVNTTTPTYNATLVVRDSPLPRRDADVDITDRGMLTVAEAQENGSQWLAQNAPELTFTQPVTVGRGSLFTPSGADLPVELAAAAVGFGLSVKHDGWKDPFGGLMPTLEFSWVVASASCDESGSITLTPLNAVLGDASTGMRKVVSAIRETQAGIAQLQGVAANALVPSPIGAVAIGVPPATGTWVQPTGQTLTTASGLSAAQLTDLWAAKDQLAANGILLSGTAAAIVLPNWAGRFMVAPGTGDATGATAHAAGSRGGEETHLLTSAEMPVHTHVQNSHNHTQNAHNHAQDAHGHNINYSANRATGATAAGIDSAGTGNSTAVIDPTTATNVAATATNVAATATNQNAGGGGAHNNMPPYVAVSSWLRVA